MLFEIMDFGDFDIKHTKIILESSNPECDMESILKEFYETSGMEKDLTYSFDEHAKDFKGPRNKVDIRKDGIRNINNSSVWTELFIDFLIKNKGFKKVKTNKITFSD